MKTLLAVRRTLAAGFVASVALATGAWHMFAAPPAAAARPVPAVPAARPAAASAVSAPAPSSTASLAVALSLAFDAGTADGLGHSGSVYLRVLPQEDAPVPAAPGIYELPSPGSPAAVAVLAPFARKVGSRVGGYDVGYWPGELRTIRSSSAYANPNGFIVVDEEDRDTPVSRHFRLGDFVTHDRQRNTWPKVVVLEEALLDKLELVLADLERHGVKADRAVILSGFRTPAHNLALGDGSGRARESRHQYGDAADLIIDVNGDGRMDDLNRDGRVDPNDVRVIERAVNRVERAYPDLVGGLGLYRGEGPAGPFAHIDVRGDLARWDRTRARPAAKRAARGGNARFGSCTAPPQFAALCGRKRG
ncbi:MAG TPA: hypothetical protein VKA84_20445 [Gemmatimonadaceae bacterium]|nr:hypothetical protein [Gemmatimonadaceae bacterium]